MIRRFYNVIDTCNRGGVILISSEQILDSGFFLPKPPRVFKISFKNISVNKFVVNVENIIFGSGDCQMRIGFQRQASYYMIVMIDNSYVISTNLSTGPYDDLSVYFEMTDPEKSYMHVYANGLNKTGASAYTITNSKLSRVISPITMIAGNENISFDDIIISEVENVGD